MLLLWKKITIPPPLLWIHQRRWCQTQNHKMSALISTETQQWEGHQAIGPSHPLLTFRQMAFFFFKDHTRTDVIFIEMFSDVFIATDLKLIELCFAKCLRHLLLLFKTTMIQIKYPQNKWAARIVAPHAGDIGKEGMAESGACFCLLTKILYRNIFLVGPLSCQRSSPRSKRTGKWGLETVGF